MSLMENVRVKLSADLFSAFYGCCDKVDDMSLQELFTSCKKHVDNTENLFATNPLVDYVTASLVFDALESICEGASAFDDEEQKLLKGVMFYFSSNSDAQDDMSSFVGFDDDVKILNVCLEVLGRNDLFVDLRRK
jgi:hypothetical protein